MTKSGERHQALHHHHEVRGSTDRAFGVVFTLVFVFVGLWPLTGDLGAVDRLNWWTFAVAAAILAIALVRPVLLAPANRLWLKFGLLLNRIVTPVVMALIFFGVLTPFAIVMRLAGKDPMRRRFDAAAPSYWIAREPGPAPETMKNQF